MKRSAWFVNRKIAIILLAVCAVVAIAAGVYFVAFSPDRRGGVVFENDLKLPEGKFIDARGRAGDLGIQKGDVFPYFLEVWYDPGQVAEIDKANLDKAVNLTPFEIRSVTEREVNLDSNMRLYQREYSLQLVSGKGGQIYELPEIAIRYKMKDSDGLLTTSLVPEPVFVASRLTGEVRDLAFGYGPLRPIATKVQAMDPSLPWIFWGLGSLIAVLGVVSMTRFENRHRTEAKKTKRQPVQDGVVYQAYRSLLDNLASGAEAKDLLYQMENIARVTLAEKEKADWLSALDGDKLPSEITAATTTLLEIRRQAFATPNGKSANVDHGLRQLDTILGFYYGQEELATWKESPDQ
jgi:flagellar basal body-associated protein FliL